jgi:hypothetical protein
MNEAYFLKPIGCTEEPVRIGQLFDQKIEKMHFARKPVMVRQGDYLIAYAAANKQQILSIYQVDSKMDQEENNRWPYFFYCTNLTPDFGASWWTYNITCTLQTFRDNFLKQNPNELLTAKGQTLNALKFGSDKLLLSPRFGKFIFDHFVK